MCRFSVYLRKSTGIYYAEFVDETTGSRIAYRSTGQRKHNDALSVAARWAATGLPERSSATRTPSDLIAARILIHDLMKTPLSAEDASRIVSGLQKRGLLAPEFGTRRKSLGEPFCAWLRNFWTFESSLYVAERLAHGQRVTRRHCQDMTSRVNSIERILGKTITLAEVRRSDLNNLGLKFKERGLAASSINKTLSAAITALRWAVANELIASDPTRGLRGFSGTKRKRGILTQEEVAKLREIDWPDKRAQIACMVAMTTGMRLGEILAIQRRDIGEELLTIRHSYSISDGLKVPKNGESRVAFLLPEVRSALLALEKTSQHPEAIHRFVFAGRYADRPLDANRILRGFRQALVATQGVSWENKDSRSAVLNSYLDRGIDFHSWRHFYAKHIADLVEPRTGQLGTGHKSRAMFEEYASHATAEDMKRLADAAQIAFGSLIPKNKVWKTA